jgi:hypothetical protein
MLCKIWGFHGGDNEECRLLGYRNPVRTSQETHYFSATGSSQLILCKIWGFNGGEYEECRLLWCYAVSLIRTNVSEECIVSIIRATRIGELGTTSAVTNNVFLRSVLQLLVTANVVPSSLILFTLMMLEAKRMMSSGMLRRVAHVRTDVSEDLSASFIRVTRIGELGKMPAVTSNRRTLQRNTS